MYGAPASIVIGGPVVGGTSNRVLFINGAGNLADDADLTFNGTTLTANTLNVSTGDLSISNGQLTTGGVDIALQLKTGAGLSQVQLAPGGTVQWCAAQSGEFFPNANNTKDLGISGLNEIRNAFFGTSINIGGDNGLKLTNQTDGAGASAGTLTNAPSAGNPSFWLPVTVNGNNRFIPCWT